VKMMAVAVATQTTEVSIAEAKARLSELVRRVELGGETIVITRRGKPVARLVPAVEDLRPGNIATDLHGLLADYPEVCDEIDKVYAERRLHKVRWAEV